MSILRYGVQYIGGVRLKMAQFRPETSLNATTNERGRDRSEDGGVSSPAR
jgi:hypothetical protein